ncbi:MAG: DUF4270 family protein [Pricia sp.]
MIFLNRIKFPVLALLALVTVFAACEEDPTDIGVGVIGGEPFNTDRAVFDVFAENKKIEAVRTNQLPVYQLGVFEHPVYGSTEARVTTQVRLSTVNPTFGDDTQKREVDSMAFENETVQAVYLYIPYLTDTTGDADGDGLIDELDDDPLDPNSDTDGDGLTDNQERVRSTDPLNPDTDGDGITDDVDDEFVEGQFARSFDLDSIYGDRTAPFELSVRPSDFFLRDLDPTTNFQESQEYFSNQDFSEFAGADIVIDTMIRISDMEILLPVEDDPATEDEDESEQVRKLPPGIRIQLDNDFFQENILDKEGSSELLNQANFVNFLRGMQLSLEPTSEEFMMLFDLTDANITIEYNYTNDGEDKNKEFRLDFITQTTNQQNQLLPIQGNAVNTFINDAYPAEIADAIASEENAERIYLKGGSGSFAEINLFDDANGREAISQIKANNWIINEANLVFYVDRTEGVIEPPRLYLYSMETGALLRGVTDAAAATSLASFPFYDGILEGDGTSGSELRYTVKITDYINDLVVRNGENATLGLTITPDIRIQGISTAMLEEGAETDLPTGATLSPLGTVLFGSNVSGEDVDKKLQLEIFYTEAN